MILWYLVLASDLGLDFKSIQCFDTAVKSLKHAFTSFVDEKTDGESVKRPTRKIAEIKCQKWEYVKFIRISSDGAVIYLQSDILECEVKWALGSVTINKASGGDGIPAELFQILKYDTVKVLQSICQQIWKTQHWSQAWKRSVFIPILKKGNAKGYSNYHTIALMSHVSKVTLKILQARLQQYVNWELTDLQAGFRKRQKNQRSNCQYPLDHRKSKRIPEKHLFLLHWLCWSLWLCGSQHTVENS